MHRAYNFSAGPAVLPVEVLQEAAADMLDYKGCGMSVMEMSHRSKMFQDIIDTAEADFRKIIGIPDNYKVLFLHGGAHLDFAMVPMNFQQGGTGVYINTGSWTKKAIKEAKKFGKVCVAASSEDKNFTYIPDCSDLEFPEDAKYLYICENNTIFGTEYHKLPNTKGLPLISDVSSNFLSRPMNINDYAMIYGGVQKNIGPAGLVIAAIREDLIPAEELPTVPTMLQYKTHVDGGSMYNTPNCWSIYVCGLVFKWILKNGGLEAMAKRNEEKAALLYNYLDNSKMFHGTVVKEDRSVMNAPFTTGDKDLDAQFIAESKKANFENLKGHRSVGGMRASMYNAMPKAWVEELVTFMEDFEKKNLK